jgi:hypothetical protein
MKLCEVYGVLASFAKNMENMELCQVFAKNMEICEILPKICNYMKFCQKYKVMT